MKEFWKFIMDYIGANIRNRRIMAAERIALRLTTEDRRNRYIIRGPKNRYVVFTNMDVELLKVKGILRSDTNVYTLSKIADSEVRYNHKTGKAYIIGKS